MQTAMNGVRVKEELLEQLQQYLHSNPNRREFRGEEVDVIDLGSSSSSSDSGSDSEAPSSTSGESGAEINGKRSRVSADGDGTRKKRRKKKKSDGDDGGGGVVLPDGFLDPLPPRETALPRVNANGGRKEAETVHGGCKQFWKAGDYAEGVTGGDWDKSGGGMDHVRVHPRFLHSNATSHKWVLGAFAELLDNSLDEVCNGATYVNVGMVKNKKDGNRMLLIEDNGGGMDPDKMRQCMSLGYSLKSKVADTIGQYGNGFKTSTMRLGADVIVFSRCSGKHGKRPTQSIGMLSYTFLRSTGKEDIVVPMLDYEKNARGWKKIIRSTDADWNRNVEAVVQWSPFSSETELLRQFEQMKDQGTRIIIYNLWEDDQGQLELDFDADPHDIQIRGVNRDEKSIQMAKQFPNSRHFLTYRHSLRSYASILYLRIPPGFRIILRGIDVEHHNIVNDMMLTKEVTYRPQPGTEGLPKDSNMVAVVTMGFVKDAKSHIDVQGFNVYHKNRLIKPFWRLWNAAGSDGRGVIGVLEANFVEPAHDKQGFERTIVLSRLETRLIQMQKTYWSSYCHKIGYAPRRNKKNPDEREYSPDFLETSSPSKKKSAASNGKTSVSSSDKFSAHTRQRQGQHALGGNSATAVNGKGHLYGRGENGKKTPTKSGIGAHSPEPLPHAEDISDDELQTAMPHKHRENGSSQKGASSQKSISRDHSSTLRRPPNIAHSDADIDRSTGERAFQIVTRSQSKGQESSINEHGPTEGSNPTVDQLIEENRVLKERLRRKEEEILGDLLHDLERERERCKSLEAELQEAKEKIEDLNKEQDSLVDIFSEERERRDNEEESLRKKLKEASTTIQELVEKVRLLEKMKTPSSKSA